MHATEPHRQVLLESYRLGGWMMRYSVTHYTLEQDGLFRLPNAQSPGNPDQIDLEGAVHSMNQAKEIRIPVEG